MTPAAARKENKLVAFFRSRSQKPTPPQSPQHPAPPRPISAATHSTIAPLPSELVPAPLVHQPDLSFSRPPPLNRPKLSIFGIGLSRKPSNPGDVDRKAFASPNDSGDKRPFQHDSRLINTSTPALPTPSSPRRLSFGLTSSSRLVHTTPSTLPPSRHLKRHSVGSHHAAHDSAVALPDDRSDSAVTFSSFLDSASSSKSPHPTLHCIGTSAKGNVQECHPEPWLPARKSFRSLPEQDSPLISITPPPENDPNVIHDYGALAVPTIDPLSSQDNPDPFPLICAPHATPTIPQIVHTPPTPQRTGNSDSPSRPATSPSTSSRGNTRPRHLLLSQRSVAVHNSLPKPHACATISQQLRDRDPTHNTRSRVRFSPRLFASKDVPCENEDRKQNTRIHDSAQVVGPPRNKASRRIKHGSFDFERPVSTLNKSHSTAKESIAKGQGLTHCRKDGVASHQQTASKHTTTSSDHTKLQTYAYHPARADSPNLSQLSPNHTGETSVVSFSSASASAQSKSTGKNSTPGPAPSSSWGHTSGRRAQRSSHGLFAFESAVSPPTSPSATSSPLPRPSPYPHRVEFEVPEKPSPAPNSSPLRSDFAFGGRFQHDKDFNAHHRGARERHNSKGRSLDLNLGLSWAPNRVRQEAVIPGLLLSQTGSRNKEEARHHGKDVTKVFESVLSQSGFEAFKKYVHRFDAHLIPLQGPRGLLMRVENLLTTCPISQKEKAELLDQFARFVEGHGDT